jgi:hypothetical protein
MEEKICSWCGKKEVKDGWSVCPSCIEGNIFENRRMLSELEVELTKLIKKLRMVLRDIADR